MSCVLFDAGICSRMFLKFLSIFDVSVFVPFQFFINSTQILLYQGASSILEILDFLCREKNDEHLKGKIRKALCDSTWLVKTSNYRTGKFNWKNSVIATQQHKVNMNTSPLDAQ